MIFIRLFEGMLAKSKTILIQGGKIVLGQTVSKQDILIQGEKIRAIGNLAGQKADEEFDARGLLVLPGAVDTHVHFNDEFMNTISVHDYYTGTRAAAFGGVTSIVDFSNQIPGKPLIQTIEVKKEEAKGKALVDWGVHPVITKPTSKILKEIPHLVQEGAPTIKLVRENNDKYDAFIIACHCDPNMDVIKEITDKPVVGIGEAAMRKNI